MVAAQAPMVKLVDTADLKSAAYLHKGRAGSSPARGTRVKIMSSYNAPFEIHVHGQVPLRADVRFEQLQQALKPLWKYAGARSLADGATSLYEEEPGIQFDPKEHVLQMCWTVRGMKTSANRSMTCAWASMNSPRAGRP